MAHTIFQTLAEFFSKYGYWVVFFGVMLENGGIPVPGEAILLFAGFLAYHGKLDLLPGILVAIVGATIGDSLGFVIGNLGGRRFVDRYIRRFPVFARSFDRAQAIFLRYGQWAVFTGRFIAGLRMFAGILAGLFRMRYRRFLFFNATGATVWVITMVYVGFLFGNSWQMAQKHFIEINEIVMIAVVVAVLIGVGVYYLRKLRRS